MNVARNFAKAALAITILVALAGWTTGCGVPVVQKRRIVVELPEWIWHGREAVAPRARRSSAATRPAAVVTGPHAAGAHAFDRLLLAHLGTAVDPSALPDGCPLGWVPLAYDEHYGGLGCDAYTAALDFPSGASTVRVELAVTGGRVLGVIASDLLPDVEAASRIAVELESYYSGHARCTAFSENGFDCDAGTYIVRVVADLNPATYHPVVTLYYYADAAAFGGYWNAARGWARRQREAAQIRVTPAFATEPDAEPDAEPDTELAAERAEEPAAPAQ